VKVGVVGSGLVGATAAYALVMRGIGREIVLVDVRKERAKAEADDILHAVPFARPLDVRAGEYADLDGCQAVILAAGVAQRPGETRLELLGRNAAVFAEIVPKVLDAAPNAILIVATNPVDVMTHLAAQAAKARGVANGRVLGSGTMLDSARFRSLLGRLVGVDSQHVHAYVIGEHGDTEVLTWSLVTIAGVPYVDFCHHRDMSLDSSTIRRIDERVRRAAYTIIEGKGATYYGVGSALARIVEAVQNDQRAVLTVCAPIEGLPGLEDVTLSLPRLVGGNGVGDPVRLPLDKAEQQALLASAARIREALSSLAVNKR
jgi:L-lactate dehydrogenase